MSNYKALHEFVKKGTAVTAKRRVYSAHITCGKINAYMRIAYHRIEGQFAETLDIGSVECIEPGKGHFTRFLTEVERLADKHGFPVFVESIMNPDLLGSLVRRGYQVSDHGLCPNAFRNKAAVVNEPAPLKT
ncbi:MAG: hypothetical protein JKY26_08160 [Pseudomonas sp.]|nr:hypothetical protein [Pseudomonas sp.]